MKKLLSLTLAILILFTLLIFVCGCSGSSNDYSEDESETIEGISSSEAKSLFGRKLIERLQSTYPNPEITNFEFNIDSVNDLGVEYEITGEYDVYIGDTYTTSHGFSGTVNKVSGTVYIDSIFG